MNDYAIIPQYSKSWSDIMNKIYFNDYIGLVITSEIGVSIIEKNNVKNIILLKIENINFEFLIRIYIKRSMHYLI